MLDNVCTLLDTNPEYNNVKTRVYSRELFILKISINNGKGIEIIKGENLFSKKDIKKIKNYIFKEINKIYREDFYRIDLEEYILFFKKVYKDDMLYLVGHALDQSILSRLLLLELREKHLSEMLN